MLQVTNGQIYEPPTNAGTLTNARYVCTDKTAKAIAILKALEADGLRASVSNCIDYGQYARWNQQTYWHSYQVYVCTDKTAKAIAILKALEADGLSVVSVPVFCALVEKIAKIL